nr:hypothetical protein [Tanacetum cinerariifolium]
MTLAEDLCSALFNDTKVKVMKGKHHKAPRGIKVSTPGSARAGSVLRRLRSAKIAGKARDRAEGSPRDDRGGKCVVSTPLNPEINKVITDFNFGALNSNLKFAMGCSNNDSIDICSLNVADSNELCNGNDGSFIKFPLDSDPNICFKCSPVAKSCSLKTSHEHTSMGDVGNTGVGIASSKDGIAIAETNILKVKGIACSGTSNEHTSTEDVVNTGCVFSSSEDGISSYKGGSDFKFGKVKNFVGILKNPSGPFFSAHMERTPLIIRLLQSLMMVVFGIKREQGSEYLALKMEYVPSSISKLENELLGNLMKMWRVYDIEEITKTNAGIFYFKFKSEEGMKKVLESGLWMIQNVPLVLNIWEPGIWLAKTEPSSIPIWVCVYNIPLELCNGNGIRKIMSVVGKPLLMDKMTRERCLKKAGKMDFARVLVEVSSEDDLPNVLEIEYPPLGNRPSRIGKLELKYKWRPPLCTHCKTFGHPTLSCKIRTRSDDEIAANTIKEAINVNSFGVTNSSAVLNEGFVTVGKKNKSIITQARAAPVKSDNYNNGNMYGLRGKGENNGRRQFVGNHKQYGNSQGFNGIGNFRRNFQRSNASNRQMSNKNVGIKNPGGNSKQSNGVEWQKKNSKSNAGDDTDDMGGINVNDEFDSKVWPDLKEEVDILIEVDDEGDVESNVEGIAMDVKLEFDVNAVNNNHSPAILAIPKIDIVKARPFKFHNFLPTKDDFIPVVKRIWSNKVEGFAMFGLVSKLKSLKKPLRKLCFKQGNLFENVKKLKSELAVVQSVMNLDPHNNSLRIDELRVLKEYKSALKDEESFLRQKSKVKWLNARDRNSKYFYNVVKGKRNRNRISYVEDMEGSIWPFLKKLSGLDALYMVRRVSDEEIKMALFDIDGNKAPGPDGFSSQFFKDSWNVVGGDVCKAVRDFFLNGKLLKEVNATVISLVPKVATPCKVSEYRPIACCNVIYKIIRMRGLRQGDPLSPYLFTFIKEVMNLVLKREIKKNPSFRYHWLCKEVKLTHLCFADDLLLFCNRDSKSVSIMKKALFEFLDEEIKMALFDIDGNKAPRPDELMRNYHRSRGHAKCAFKIDFEKAYDSVEWDFLANCLKFFGFHDILVKWVMNCVSSTSFTINVNGDHKGFFKGMRGLRQGDPLSPYLFTFIKEVMNLVLKREIKKNPSFRYHWLCKEVKLTHLCFADDLLLFCNKDSKSVSIMKKALYNTPCFRVIDVLNKVTMYL